ncbi:unnamed protein product [Adineta steineri]|uniref:NAD(P)(+)--arginine ADP-ribosyltransferase n=1 Tax=Adineta steineri TaxID=433720 RepID=A0A816BV49_9BILA|nr:unnamed protein product [Adineta steineri]CAF1614359.1 unnamed protein product [Adineta steineri]
MATDGGDSYFTQRVLRFTDIAQEPMDFLMPISGYEEMPIVSLEEAVEPLVSILPKVKSHAYVAKKRCKKPADNLTQDESASIMLYSMEWAPLNECLYCALNTTLRSENRTNLKPWFLFLRLFLAALSRLPQIPHLTVFRGVKLDLSKQYKEDETFIWWGFSSCTTSIKVLQSEQFLGMKGTRTMFTIHCNSARDIRKHSYYPSEDEVLLLAATEFQVKGILNQGHGLQTIQLQEVQSDEPMLIPVSCTNDSVDLSAAKLGDLKVKDDVTESKIISKQVATTTPPSTPKPKAGASDLDHPEFCVQGGDCTNISQKHLVAYRHLPNCSDGSKCPKYRRRDQEHLKSFRHCKSVCLYDNCCANIHDKAHLDNIIHSFRPPCPLTPYNCSKYIEFVQSKNSTVSSEIEDHCLEYSHICPYGRDCKIKEENHLGISIHIARRLCPDGNKCSKLTQEDHLESYTHHDIRDIRILCQIPGFKCLDRFNEDHFKKYRHNKNHDHFSVAPSSNLNASINFARNQSQLIKMVNNYVERMNWEKTSISPEIRNWIRALQPVHRCRKDIFESILILGHVMSRRFMDLLRKPEHVVRVVQQHSRVRLIFLHHNTPNVKDNVCKLIEILVEAEFIKANSYGKTLSDSDYGYKIQRIEQKLQPPLNPRDIQVIHEWSVKIAQASIKLNANPTGIRYHVDKKLGTDQHVFGVLGPNLGHYYGEIVITFKQEIMFHPDANFSIQAATKFHSRATYSHRPWTRDPGNDGKRIEHFHSSRLHCSVHGYEYAAASELIALTGADRKSMNVSIEAILDRWINVDSHELFEAHLPQLIPLDYIDRVYIPKNVFESLSPEAQQSAKGAFKDSLMISIYESDEIKQGTTLKEILDLPYQKYVFEQHCEAIRDQMNKPNISRGIVITVAASEFEEHVVSPTTISQAYHLYYLDKPQSHGGHKFTYIYWQAMNGDMMLTVANEKLIPGEQQFNLQCLVCYIAEKPSTVTEEYHEAFSYLNDGLPFQHGNNVTTNRYKAKSNTFYRGCNTDDYFTFCLKISHMTGQVTLSHAGPNSIYNHEKIECQFNTSEFDLSKLEFIHLSAGSQDVPVRNLTINFELIPELHPTVDMNFKKDTSNLLEKYLVAASYVDQNAFNNNGTGGGRPMQVIPPTQLNTPSTLRRVADIFLCRCTNAIEPAPLNDALPTLKPCEDSIYCLQQRSSMHTIQYSHPCGYSELCVRKAKEPYLTHERHNALRCAQDKNCLEKHDPVHRAIYRHTNLPDYLIPCHKQDSCVDKSAEHRIEYFHGETIPIIKRKS